MKFKKLLAVFASMTLVAAALCSVGCAPKDPTPEIKEMVSGQLDKIKNLDQSYVDQLKETLDNTDSLSGLEEYGVDPVEIVSSMFGDFDYTINEITAKDNSGTVTVTITSKDLGKLSSFSDEMEEELTAKLLQDSAKLQSMSKTQAQEYAVKVAMEMLQEEIDGLKTVENDPITIDVVQKDGKWQLADEAGMQESVTEAMGFTNL